MATTRDPLLRFFRFEHLPEPLKTVSQRFSHLAEYINADLPSCAERTVALRKLLEAKDCAVRSMLPPE